MPIEVGRSRLLADIDCAGEVSSDILHWGRCPSHNSVLPCDQVLVGNVSGSVHTIKVLETDPISIKNKIPSRPTGSSFFGECLFIRIFLLKC